MKKSKVFAASVLTVCLTVTSISATASNTNSKNSSNKATNKSTNSQTTKNNKLNKLGKGFSFDKQGFMGRGHGRFQMNQDPLKMLQSRKENIQAMQKDGKITETDANAQIAKIDAQIKEIEAFNALTLDEKKAKLTSDYKTNLQKQVTDGKLTQDKADAMLKEYTDRLANWDGTGYMGLEIFGDIGRGNMGGPGSKDQGFRGPEMMGQNQDPLKMLQSRKDDIQTKLKDGKITQADATAEIAKIDAKIKEIEAFNALTLDEKKAKLTSDYKTNLQKQVTDGKLTQDKADTMLKEYSDKIANWDGTGYPEFGMFMAGDRGFMGVRGGFGGFDKMGAKQDPLKMLQSKKDDIQTKLKDGKITQADANTEIAKIDAQIKEIEAFNALSLEDKKVKLTNDYKANLEKQVQDGKLTQLKADEMLKNYTDKLSNWDGTGYPQLGNFGAVDKHYMNRGGFDSKKMVNQNKSANNRTSKSTI
ncbi:MAG: hypothetical protein Q8942_01050 [Bacillota bacterium]|nr:hypothetical protein [Bacillota bacterium]